MTSILWRYVIAPIWEKLRMKVLMQDITVHKPHPFSSHDAHDEGCCRRPHCLPYINRTLWLEPERPINDSYFTKRSSYTKILARGGVSKITRFFQTHIQPCTVQPAKGQQIMKSFISNWWLSGKANSPDVSEHGQESVNKASTNIRTVCPLSHLQFPFA